MAENPYGGVKNHKRDLFIIKKIRVLRKCQMVTSFKMRCSLMLFGQYVIQSKSESEEDRWKGRREGRDTVGVGDRGRGIEGQESRKVGDGG